MFNVELIDHRKEWDDFLQRIKGLTDETGCITEVGLFGPSDLVEIAEQNELGDPPRGNRKWPIPERSFMRYVFDKDIDKNTKLLFKGIDDIILKKRTVSQVLNQLGDEVATDIKNFILSDYYKSSKPNHPITVRIKGHDHPLIQIGKMFSLITHKIGKDESSSYKTTTTVDY